MKWNNRNYRTSKPEKFIKQEIDIEDLMRPLGEKIKKGNYWIPIPNPLGVVAVNVPPVPITPTPTTTPTITPTSTLTPTPTITPTKTGTPTPTPSITPTQTITPTPSITPTQTITPTNTATPTQTLTPTQTVTPTPSITPTSSLTPTPSITPTQTITPTNTQTPTITPTNTPTKTLTPTPSATPPPNLLLNIYTGATTAYSMRKLDKNYAGSAIRVRRSNDNSEQNIGFDGSGNLDTSALSTFVGANSAFITTWYDQSGNNRNLIQATATNQPRIVNAGTIDTKGTQGKPAIKFDGSNDFLRLITGLTSSNISAFIVAGQSDGSRNVFCLNPSTGNDYNNADSALLETAGGAELLAWMNNFANGVNMWYIAQSGAGTTPYQLINAMKQTTGAQLLTSGVTQSSVTKALPTQTHAGLIVGARFENSLIAGPYFEGVHQELIIYFTDQTSNLTNINNNINAYYGIY